MLTSCTGISSKPRGLRRGPRGAESEEDIAFFADDDDEPLPNDVIAGRRHGWRCALELTL